MIDFLQAAREREEFLRAWRRDLHRHPELGFQEYRTAGLVADELVRLGIETRRGVAETGVVGLIKGQPGGAVVMLRFDMDALPITEENDVDYRSSAVGKMHACGHDGHVAMGLGVAQILHQQRSSFKGTVKLVFQPAEEALGGAEKMIKAGVLDDPSPCFALGMHLWNDRPVGWLGITPGPVMAGSAIFDIHIQGKGGHGAQPQQTRDPIAAAGQMITALQSVVSRNIHPLEPAVLSITRMHAGDAHNVIPGTAKLAGTIRWYDESAREKIYERMRSVIKGIAQAMDVQAEVIFQEGTPALINDRTLADKVAETAQDLFPDFEVDRNFRTMGSEDMAFFHQSVPGCYFHVGSANAERGLAFGHHHPRFDFDERALVIGTAVMSRAAMRLLA